MRIALVIENLDPGRGGVEQWTWQFAGRLVAAGHETHVVAREFADDATSLGICVHRIGEARSRLEFAADAERCLAELHADVIHDTGCGWQCDVFQPHGGARGAAFEQNLRLLAPWVRPLKRRMAAWLPRYREFAELNARQYAGRDRLFVAISKMVARDLQEHHGVRPEQIRLVYNGVDVERFSPEACRIHRDAVRERLGLRPEDVLLLIVAHNFPLKGGPTLLRAASRLKDERHPVKVCVVGGKGPARSAVASRLQGSITSAGSVADAVPFYAAADVYVQPTFYDPCSLVALEALSCGLPVVTSRFNGAAELMTPGLEGFVVNDPGDDRELADCLRPLMDAACRRTMGRAARELATEHPLERNCRELIEVYEEVLGRRRLAA